MFSSTSPRSTDWEGPKAETVCDTDSDRESRFDISTSAMRRRRESVGPVSRRTDSHD